MLTAWQPYPGAPLFVFDAYLIEATMILRNDCHHDAGCVINQLNSFPPIKQKHITIIAGRFIQ